MTSEKPAEKNPAAVALGRLGGKASREALTAEEASERGRRIVNARWKKAKTKAVGDETKKPNS